jgi:hypothetical protein
MRSPGNENILYKFGFFQKYFGQVLSINCNVSKKIFCFLTFLFGINSNCIDRKKLNIKLVINASKSKNLL